MFTLILSVGFISCHKKKAGDKKITVGVIILGTRGEWMSELIQGLKDGAEDMGIDVNVVSSDGDISKESGIIDTFISKGVDAIALMPQSDQGSIVAFERVVDSEIPVVTMNSKVDTPLSKVFVGVDNYTLGTLAGTYAAKYITE